MSHYAPQFDATPGTPGTPGTYAASVACRNGHTRTAVGLTTNRRFSVLDPSPAITTCARTRGPQNSRRPAGRRGLVLSPRPWLTTNEATRNV